jgi:hypothetical protein
MSFHTVCLIIDSYEPFSEHYESQRKLWQEYMNLDPEIKCYFLRCKNDLLKTIEVDNENNIIYIKGNESYIPGILIKTLKAMEYVYNNFDFKYLIRTNISSFWDFKTFKKVFNNYQDNLVKAPIGLEGHVPFPGGSGMVISRDVVGLMASNQYYFNYHIIDDRAIGLFLNSFDIKIIDGENDRFLIEHHINDQNIVTELLSKINNVYTFRVKYDRGRQDNFVGKTLLNLIYK